MVFRMGISPVDSNMKIGPVRSHLYNYAFAKKVALDGRESLFIMKCDDTDPIKHKKDNFQKLFSFFTSFLGMDIDIHPFNSQEKIGASLFQSDRGYVYDQWLEKLIEGGFVFLENGSRAALFDIKRYVDLCPEAIEIDDLLFGKIAFRPVELLKSGSSIFPLTRSDGSYLYHFASVVDDHELGVTHVFRGQDKIAAAPYQEMVRISLGFKAKRYVHTPLLLGSEGRRLNGAVHFDDFLRDGITMQALISYIISSGYGDPDDIYLTLTDFISKFSPEKIHKANGAFDRKKLEKINKRIVRQCCQNDYLAAISFYADRFGDGRYADRIKQDCALRQMLAVFRKKPDESIELLKQVFHPEFTYIDPDFRTTVRRILGQMEKDCQSEDIQKFSFGLQQSMFFQGLRWILMGVPHGADVATIYFFLMARGLLKERINEAKQALSTL